jgi:hypothetical protein
MNLVGFTLQQIFLGNKMKANETGLACSEFGSKMHAEL